ncbi:glycosyl transferase family 2 [uncultured Winogradskyella sp.]|uniref:glycosyl transferase family 2 n=1 Tax=uncultured Winogradskyella sp. TaxID=395353 RepID=UPI0030DCDD52|tara:strand:+ start:142133 stop:143287 length:1155 start_codon:yes stop_codon:yes gene_type:complete
MRTIKELQLRLYPKNSFNERYDIEQDDKIHLLYVSPMLNATGYYRMIIPALEINKTDTHKAIITSIETNDFSRKLSDFVNQLDERLIAWADYIIFPPLFSDVSYLMQAIKTLNPSIQLVMDLDRNYFAIPVSIPLSRKLTTEKLKSLENNLGLMDIVTVANEAFQKFLQRFIDDRLEKANTFVQFLPSLVSRFGYEEMPPLIRNNSEKLRIGLIKPSEEDSLSLKEVLLKINSSFKKEIEFVCLGKPHSSKEVDLLLKEIDCELHDSVSFLDYFEKLNSLQLDLVLLPAKEGLYNRHQNSQLFLELSVFGIPVIASIYHPAKLLLKEGETGLLASEVPEWIENIGLLIKDVKSKERLGRNALKWSWRFQSYNAKNIELLTQIFI